jgi:signal transduction histidine kinase
MLRKLIMISEINRDEDEEEAFQWELMLRKFEEEYLPLCKEANIDFRVEYPKNETIITHEFFIQTILENLLENAFEFIDMHKTAKYIHLKIERSANTLHLQVKDNGVGIDPAFQDRIFEMYFRANEHSKGNGLGLFVTLKAIHKLKGAIHFVSQLGEFTQFDVEIPLSTPAT